MRKPILTYKDKKFYDLDEIPMYIDTLWENEEYEECKKFRRNIREQIKASEELYEMAQSRSDFIHLCADKKEPVHFTIANIICLEDICPDTINHWKKELLGWINEIIKTKTKSGIKRGKIVIGQLISDYAEPYKDGYSYTDSIIYEEAMKKELSKSYRKNMTLDQQRTGQYIKSDILPNVEYFVEPNKERVYHLFNGLINACDKSDISIFRKALEKFILS